MKLPMISCIEIHISHIIGSLAVIALIVSYEAVYIYIYASSKLRAENGQYVDVCVGSPGPVE